MSTFYASPTMTEFMLSKKYNRVLAGPIGGGKSVACVHELLRWASEQEPNAAGERKTRFLICRNTVDQLRSTTMKTFFDWVPQGVTGEWKATDKTFYMVAAKGDGTVIKAEFLFIALDTPDDVRKALSLEATGLWGNEARELHPEVVDGLLMRVNRYPSMKDGGATRAGAIFDTNMPGEDTWWQEKMTNPPKNWSIHIQPPAVISLESFVDKYGDQPDPDTVGTDIDGNMYAVDPASDNFKYLAKTYYPNTMEGKTKDFIGVYLRCLFGRSLSGQPVFESFISDFHVAQKPLTPILNGLRPVLIGLDFGLTPAAVIGQLDARGRLNIFDCLVSEGMGILRFCTTKLKPLLSAKYAGASFLVIGDPAGNQRVQTDEKTIYQVLREQGFKCMPASTNSIVARITAVDQFLCRQIDGGPGFLVDKGCPELIAALRGKYRYKVKKDGTMEDTPEKNDASHISDALQYLCLHAEALQGGKLEKPQARKIEVAHAGGWT